MQTRKIKRIISHPFFNDYTYDYDIAVVELQSPVTFSSVVQPICLPDATHSFPVGKDLWVTGWGATVEGGERWRCLANLGLRGWIFFFFLHVALGKRGAAWMQFKCIGLP